MRHFDSNNSIGASDYVGPLLFALKELAILCGWTVKGSGSGTGGTRFAYSGITSALPGGEQGSGGAYDCWMTAATRTNNTPVIEGDAGNANAWCVLENNGVEVLLSMPTGTGAGAWIGYGRIVLNTGTGSSPTFDGSVAAAGTIPGAASNEIVMIGTSRTGDSLLTTYGEAGYYHIWGDDTPGEDGITPFGYVWVRSTGNVVGRYAIVCSPEVGSTPSMDEGSVYACFGTTPPNAGSLPGIRAYNIANSRNESAMMPYGQFWGGSGNTIDGDDSIRLLEIILDSTAVTAARLPKGTATSGSLALSASQRDWGHYGVDQNGAGWVHLGGTGGMIVPWPDASTVPLPGAGTVVSFHMADSFPLLELSGVESGATTYYYQRVWDSGSGGRWCYYEKTEVDPTPLSTETSPNYTGSISAHSVMATRQA